MKSVIIMNLNAVLLIVILLISVASIYRNTISNNIYKNVKKKKPMVIIYNASFL